MTRAKQGAEKRALNAKCQMLSVSRAAVKTLVAVERAPATSTGSEADWSKTKTVPTDGNVAASSSASGGGAGRRTDALGLLSELQHLSTRRYVSAYRIALVHAGLGDRDAAFAALDRACEERAIGLVNVGVDPRVDPLRSDPHYQRILRRLRLGDGVGDPRRT